MSSIDPGARPIRSTDLQSALSDAGATYARAPTGEDAFWVRYTEVISVSAAGELWFRARTLQGVVHLSASYSNARLIRNGIDLLELSFRLAAKLGARVFESENARLPEATLMLGSPRFATRLRIEGQTEEHVMRYGRRASERLLEDRQFHAMVASGSEWIQSLTSAWRHVHDSVDCRPLGALEVPVGSLDLVPEYAVLEVRPEQSVSLETFVRAIVALGTRADITESNVIQVFDGASVVASVILRPGDGWQFWPRHARVSWRRIFGASMNLTRILRGLGGGTPQVGRVVIDDALGGVPSFLEEKVGSSRPLRS